MLSVTRLGSTAVASAMPPSAKPLAALKITKPAATSGSEPPATADGASVAVIDDDERVSKTLAFQLKAAGFQAVSYSSARDFLAAKDTRNFDCVVADILMP